MDASFTARGNRMVGQRRIAQGAQPQRVVSVERCALGLYWAWVWLFYETDALFAGVSGSLAVDQFRFASLLVMSATLLIGAATRDKHAAPVRGFFYPTAADGDQLPEYNSILVRMFSALGIYGLIYGVLRAYAASSHASSADVATVLFLIVGICLAAYVRSARFKSLTLFWRLIFPVTLIGIILTPLYGNPGGFLAAPIAQAGYLLFESLVWIILFDVIAQLRLNGIAVFGVGRGITALAMAVGSFAPDQLLGGAFAAFLAENALPVLIVAIIALAVVNFFVLNEKEVAIAGLLEIRDDDRAQLAEIADKGQVTSNLFDCISERYQLTNREREVLELLSAGKSGPQISETLVLSKATVKTHAYNIYKKLEVHTRAELLAFVQNFR